MTQNRSFQEMDIPSFIDSAESDFISDFYNPLLANSRTYKRGVGFFTSNWIRSAARGMSKLAENGGTARWVASPILEEDDWEAIRRGNKAKRNEILRESLESSMDDLQTEIEENVHNAIAWMIFDGLLEIKLAVPEDELTGNFHDKFGVFVDSAGNRVAFHGSQNDSQQALANYESYDVFCDWHSQADKERVDGHERRFEKMWNDTYPNLGTYSIPRSVMKDIVKTRKTSERPYPEPRTEPEENEITLRDYQDEAVKAWFENGQRGMFEMATGTGKTYTAIGALRRTLEKTSSSLGIVIAVPVTHLAHQWREALEEWDYSNVRMVFGSENPQWRDDLSDGFSDLNIDIQPYKIFITTHRTLASDYFIETVESASCGTFLIADEVHGIGSEHQRRGLSQSYDYRIGLSATPERFFDEAGTGVLEEYFGGVVFEYNLEDAIPEHLAEYEYYPRVVELTEEEIDEYRNFSRALATEYGKESPDEDRISQLLINRSQILKSAVNKYSKLEEILEQIGEPNHLLVYTNHEQIDGVQEVLNKHGIIQHKFTFEEGSNERETLLNGFANGEWDALVAMRCLDEGVDVPSTRQAILMSSSTNPKQFIQRRGRVLRKAEGKESAAIFDMIVVPSLNPSREMIKSEQSILSRELDRFEEFARTAKNEVRARNQIQRVRTLYEIGNDEEN